MPDSLERYIPMKPVAVSSLSAGNPGVRELRTNNFNPPVCDFTPSSAGSGPRSVKRFKISTRWCSPMSSVIRGGPSPNTASFAAHLARSQTPARYKLQVQQHPWTAFNGSSDCSGAMCETERRRRR